MKKIQLTAFLVPALAGSLLAACGDDEGSEGSEKDVALSSCSVDGNTISCPD
ncbi:MAG: hypothetical protein MK135_00340 [Polyangiaceae bacterium]|nr:hypothetical protein [Polyangiaceae bacterium]